MFGHAFLQCTTDEATHRLLHEALGVPAEERNTMREDDAGPFPVRWLADIRYDTFGHLRFFGVEADLAALAGEACGASLPETLSKAFSEALADAFGAELAGRLPPLQEWDCNTLQYAAEPDDAGLGLLAGRLGERRGWPGIIAGGKHAGPAFTLDLVRREDGAALVATCRRPKLNALLQIKGLGRRPLFRLLEGQTARDVMKAAIKKHADGPSAERVMQHIRL
jgi:hypothetical protein